MTLVGKILSVMLMVLSVLFMGFAIMTFANQRDWPAEVAAINQKVLDAEAAVEQRQAEMQRLRRQLALEQAARRNALVVLEVKALDLQAELKQVQDQYEAVASEQRRNNETLNNFQVELQRLMDNVVQLRTELENAIGDRNTKLEMITDLTDRLHQGEGELRRLRVRNQQLTDLAVGT